MKLPIIRLTGIGLYSLSRLAVGEIKEIIVRWSGGGYFELDQNSHVIINGDGKAFTNNFSFLDQKYDPYYREGVALVALLAGHGARYQPNLPQPQPSSDKRQPPPVGAKQAIDFGSSPPNDKQLNSLAHVLAIMCLGLRLNVDSIKTLAEIVNLDKEFKKINSGYGSVPPSLTPEGDSLNLLQYPCEMGSGGEVIRARTQEVLDDMKKGLYRSINPALAEHTIGTLRIKN